MFPLRGSARYMQSLSHCTCKPFICAVRKACMDANNTGQGGYASTCTLLMHSSVLHLPCRNNNAGGVAKSLHQGLALAHDVGAGLGAIAEDEEEEEEEEDDNTDNFNAADVPQCFSHFTYVATGGQKLVCDLQV
jgi:hypothetical protein